MRMSKPRNWFLMTDQEKREYEIMASKHIIEAKRIAEKRFQEMKKAGVFDHNTVVGYPETEVIKAEENKMEWFPGGIF